MMMILCVCVCVVVVVVVVVCSHYFSIQYIFSDLSPVLRYPPVHPITKAEVTKM